jgi:UDP-galactopyranose mutase
MNMYDWLVVGAGFAGATLAERLASQRGEQVLVIDRRPHVAGNAYDHVDAAGVLVHRYGPHIFHTNSKAIVAHLSQFTQWRDYEHRVLAHVDGQLVPIPINLDTVNRLYDLDLDGPGMEAFLAARREPVADIRTSEDVVVSTVGRELYEKFFRGYSRTAASTSRRTRHASSGCEPWDRSRSQASCTMAGGRAGCIRSTRSLSRPSRPSPGRRRSAWTGSRTSPRSTSP